MQHEIEDHDRGLVHDLQEISRQLIDRRRALAWFGGVGSAAILAGCGGGGTSSSGTASSASAGSTSTTTSSSTSGATTTTSTTSSTATSGQCIADPTETAGPYPADGTNSASGSTSNILTQSGIDRSDIRSSFISSTTVANGVLMMLTLTLVNVNNACTPLAGYAVYLWHCDINGNYSLYSAPNESYLRGVQVTNSSGQVTFTSIFPACYSGRYPHIHFEIFSSLSAATSGRRSVLTSQLAMPRDICTTVYATSDYSASVSRLAAVTTANDNVFGDNSSAQIAVQTPVMSGSVAAGYVATATVGIAI